MGTFAVSVRAVGNHGCQREKKSGEGVEGCGATSCTDCITREYVAKLRASGASVEIANVTHWPGTDSQVIDNLIGAKKRSGNF